MNTLLILRLHYNNQTQSFNITGPQPCCLDNFLQFLQTPNKNMSTDIMLKTYLENNLRQNTTSNPAGVCQT
jgi:hypothetical protein